MSASFDINTLLFLSLVFTIGGLVKGVIGTGLPTIALALMVATVGLKEGMALILLPSILTNIHQGLLGGELKVVCQRCWPFFLTTFCTVWLGAALITIVRIDLLSMLLGAILFTYSCIGMLTPRLPAPGRWEKVLSPLLGSINGLITGLTGSSVIPGVLYLQSLDMKRNQFIQTMGLLFLISTTTLGLALNAYDLLSPKLLSLSLLACLPAFLGVSFGIYIRHRISENTFRKLFFLFMLALSIYISVRSLIQL